jgi:hypothetical protein
MFLSNHPMSQHCHCPVIEIDVWVELLLAYVFGDGKSANRQVCWVSAFPADRACDHVDGGSNAFSIAAAVLVFSLMRTVNINSIAIAMHMQSD